MHTLLWLFAQFFRRYIREMLLTESPCIVIQMQVNFTPRAPFNKYGSTLFLAIKWHLTSYGHEDLRRHTWSLGHNDLFQISSFHPLNLYISCRNYWFVNLYLNVK